MVALVGHRVIMTKLIKPTACAKLHSIGGCTSAWAGLPWATGPAGLFLCNVGEFLQSYLEFFFCLSLFSVSSVWRSLSCPPCWSSSLQWFAQELLGEGKASNALLVTRLWTVLWKQQRTSSKCGGWWCSGGHGVPYCRGQQSKSLCKFKGNYRIVGGQ